MDIQDTVKGTVNVPTIQGAKPTDSLNEVCPWIPMGTSIKGRLYRYLSSKIAGAFTLKGRGGRHRIFEVYLLGLRLEMFLSKNHKRGHTTMSLYKATSKAQRIRLALLNHPEFSFVSDEKLGKKSYTHWELQVKKDLEQKGSDSTKIQKSTVEV